MKRSLLLIFFVFSCVASQAQKDTVSISPQRPEKNALADASSAKISIYPNPVRENYFNIRFVREITFVKVTNIIGQDIFKEKYNTPVSPLRIMLDNPGRGMYLVTMILGDGTRVVKKIMIEQAE
jgi:hypothetical protein